MDDVEAFFGLGQCLEREMPDPAGGLEGKSQPSPGQRRSAAVHGEFLGDLVKVPFAGIEEADLLIAHRATPGIWRSEASARAASATLSGRPRSRQ